MSQSSWNSSELAMAAYATLQNGQTRDLLGRLTDIEFTPTQATEFAKRYPFIVTQFNDTLAEGGMGTGFSATVFSDAGVGGNLTLAIRGTQEIFGDIAPTDAEILASGAGYDQIVAMANWWLRVATPGGQMVRQYRLTWLDTNAVTAGAVVLRTDGNRSYILDQASPVQATGELSQALLLDPDHRVEVTGHSLGGHLGMAFSTIFAQQSAQVTVFNAPGFIDNPTIESYVSNVLSFR